MDRVFESVSTLAPRSIRLNTLTRLRWFAIFGQGSAVIVTAGFLDLDVAVVPCVILIGLLLGLNFYITASYPRSMRLKPAAAALLLGCDIIQLAALLYCTGGLENPFALLILVPVVVSIHALPLRLTIALGVLVAVLASVLAIYHLPLPLPGADINALPPIYRFGTWVALVFGLGFTAIYTWRVAEDERELNEALAAAQIGTERERHLIALDGLAAATAHALATPLSTIALVAGELARDASKTDLMADDLELLRSETRRCRDILFQMSSMSSDTRFQIGEPILLSQLAEDALEHHDLARIAISIKTEPGDETVDEPMTWRNPTVSYSIRNFVDNAIDFANSRVVLTVGWNTDHVWLSISDDGPGFSQDILDRLGDPFITSRPASDRKSKDQSPDRAMAGMGLGFFIAKTILERQGAQIRRHNKLQPETGAEVTILWPRSIFETDQTLAPTDS